MTHAHPHGDGQPAPASRRVVLALAAVMSVLLLATVVALVVLWPKAGELPAKRSVFYEGAVPVSGTVERIVDPGDVATGQPGKIAVTLDDAGDEVLVDMGPSLVDDNIVGARVRLVRGPVDLTGEPVYSYMDFHRSWPLIGLGIAFVVVVVAVARLKGLAALGGLAGALALVWFFTLPALLAGRHGLAVALTTASAVLFIVVYLAHGVSVKSTTALLGTFAGVAAVTSLAAWAIPGAHLTPIVRDDLAQLPYIAPGIHVTGVLLCGMVLGGVGVLNDVTITQASSVWELRAAAPTDSRRRVFARAMRIGRDHIASTV
ncbi:MAG: YibE/F family protein, partial [Propionibacteriaceae bacterium]|nr:YibE/F family protein [Propionibacteriaceae bacterium]